VVPEKPDGYYESLSWEQALRYQADVIFYDARTLWVQPEQLAKQVPTWNRIPAVQAGQVRPWVAVPTFSYEGFAGILEEMARTIREVDPHVVP